MPPFRDMLISVAVALIVLALAVLMIVAAFLSIVLMPFVGLADLILRSFGRVGFVRRATGGGYVVMIGRESFRTNEDHARRTLDRSS